MSLGKIILIEDNPMNMELTMDVLEAAGYKVIPAYSAEEGIRLAKSESPALILMDVSLPGMDGLEATAILKKDPLTRDLPVIAITAHAMPGDRERIINAGCCAYISKPINIESLRAEVKRFIKPISSHD